MLEIDMLKSDIQSSTITTTIHSARFDLFPGYSRFRPKSSNHHGVYRRQPRAAAIASICWQKHHHIHSFMLLLDYIQCFSEHTVSITFH